MRKLYYYTDDTMKELKGEIDLHACRKVWFLPQRCSALHSTPLPLGMRASLKVRGSLTSTCTFELGCTCYGWTV